MSIRMALHVRLLLTAALALLGLVLTAAGAQAAKPVPGHWIVTIKKDHDPRGVANGVGAKPQFVYESALNGFAAELNEGQLNGLRNNPNVEAIEQDATADLTTTQAMDGAGDPWGLDRIDQHPLPLSASYGYSKTGSGVNAYVIDTGIQSSHPEFKVVTPWFSYSRASNVYDAFGGSGEDCHSHGTHVAGTIGGKTFGVAKQANLRGVRVFDCFGNTTVSKIIAGVDFVRAKHVKPAVANMSLRVYPVSAALNTATANLVSAGVFVAVAAGNDNINACNVSPASVASAMTVAGTDKFDKRYTSSNYGGCVDVYGPAVSVKSAVLAGGTGWKTGTSMASPHVAGTGALLCSYGASYCAPSYITSWINTWATGGVVINNLGGTPNKLLYKGAL